MNKEKHPPIRFSGFTEAWEQRKLGELTEEFKSGSSIKAENILEKGIFPVYGGNGVRGYTNTFNHDGDFALIGRQGALSGNMNFSVGKAYFTEHAVAVKANSQNDTRFLYFLMDKLKLGKWVTQSAQPGLAVGTLIEIKALIPNNIKEQQLMSSFFKQLDETITLQERELALLREQKKGFLQKMFPKEGSQFPEVRFPGFTDAWEQSKLEEVIISELKGKAKANMLGNDSIYLDANYLNGGEVSYVDSPSDVEIDDVLILWDGSQAGTVYQGFEGALGSTLKAYKSKILGHFLFQSLKRKQQIIYESYRTPNIPHVIKTFTSEFKIKFPSREEQEKVGSFFKQLDDTIILQERKLEKLKDVKKGFLQKMFV